LVKTDNKETVTLVYSAVIIMFLLFEIYILGEEWQSLVMSLSSGFIFGIVWAHLSLMYIKQDYDSKKTPLEKDGSILKKCDGSNQNEDMVCRAFRL